MRLFRALAYWLSNSVFKKKNDGYFEDNFSAQIEVSGRLNKKNVAAASYLPRISRPKYGKP